ncbi:unnamed protein product [Pedinophyceae sp. YPF-701]|nr:unnamed protein product [Pedinophyceae sp. YPF-701]
MSGTRGELLTVLFDCTALYWGAVGLEPDARSGERPGTVREPPIAHPLPLSAALHHTVEFLHAYQLIDDAHRVAIFTVSDAGSRLIYEQVPLDDAGSGAAAGAAATAPQSLAAALVAGTRDAVLESLHQRKALGLTQTDIAALPPSERKPKLLLAAALTRALCYANRALRAAAASGAPAPRLRMLCLTACPDTPTQYISTMNAVFAAKELECCIDTCMLGTDDSAFLQQAAHVTGGTCLRMKHPGTLLQHLTLTFAAGPEQRRKIRHVAQDRVDLRPACFCHKRPVSIGYVCSVCLSIFCSDRKRCGTCGAENANRIDGAAAGGAPGPS